MLRSGPRNERGDAMPIAVRSEIEQELAGVMFKDFVSFTSHRWENSEWKTYSKEEVIRDWSKLELSDNHVMADKGKYGRIRACEQLGCFWTDTKNTFAILALLEPEFAIEADKIDFIYSYNPIRQDEESYCDTDNILQIIYKDFVHFQVETESNRFFTSNADMIVTDWMNGNAESKYNSVNGSEDLNSLFGDYRLINILVDVLQVKFEAAEVGMLKRYKNAVYAGTANEFYPKRRKPPGDLLFAEFVLSFLGVEQFNVEQEKNMLNFWVAWETDARHQEVENHYHSMTNDELPVSEIIQLLTPEFDKRINRKNPPTDETCMGIHDPPWTLCMAR